MQFVLRPFCSSSCDLFAVLFSIIVTTANSVFSANITKKPAPLHKKSDAGRFSVTMLYRLFSAQLTVHIECRPSSVAHGEDDRRTTAHDIAAGIDGRNRAPHLVVHGNRVLPAEFKSFD